MCDPGYRSHLRALQVQGDRAWSGGWRPFFLLRPLCEVRNIGPTHPGLLLDAPQWPSESSQGYYLLFFRFAQDVAHTEEGYCLASESTSPSLILVGRFSSDPHWPVLGDR